MTNTRFLICLLAGATLNLGPVQAAPAHAAIGMAVTDGSIRVDRALAQGSATIFDGSTVETDLTGAVIRLDAGVRLRLAPETHVRIYPGRLELESGLGQIESAAGYEVEARTLRISPAEPDGLARVRVGADRRVTVAAVRGSVRVLNVAGVLVGHLEEGRSLDFEPQEAGAAAPTHATGCLLVKSGKPILAEQTTNVILELRGAMLAEQIGNRVTITGLAVTAPVTVEHATQLIKVAGLKLVAKGGCTGVAKRIGASVAASALVDAGSETDDADAAAVVAAAAAAGAGGAAAAGAAAGGAAAGAAAAGAGAAAAVGATTVAVVGGVAASATVGGLAATGSLPGQKKPATTASR